MEPELVREFYHQELEIKHRLDSRLAGFLTIMSIIGGLLYVAIRDFTAGINWITWIFASLVIASILWYVPGVVSFWKGTFGHDYAKVPVPSKMEKFLSDVRSHHAVYPGPREPEAVANDALAAGMMKAIDQNAERNYARGELYYTAMKRFAISGILALAACGTPLSAKLVTKVWGDGTKQEAKMREDKEPAQTTDPKGSTEQPAVQAPLGPPAPAAEAPVAPENTAFKWHQEPSMKRIIPADTGRTLDND